MRKLCLASALLFSSFSFAAESVNIHDPYARAVPPGQPNSAAFMQLENATQTDLAVITAQSSASEVAELHTHTNVDGVMQMRQVDSIALPAGETTELKPGGLHIMLIGLKQPLADGDQIDLTLTFSDGSATEVTVPVRHIMPMAKAQ
ncbi:copper chaperone PCu(A)C [Nitrincola iocasae]|uniref:Copper chaperone PCu(A)C n=1 Tax=Nitrincola iocasae TaxID=2614693 RepID=A0A5J6LBX0_9GAMM|nr:copper chaperone PCu(A)C [Nitrincola iocasae]QEW06075.1 copper chaperone PCu(A)C [Nitrincola iocasae]